MSKLKEIIAAKIGSNGPINIAEFMGDALGYPELGYYHTRDPFGSGGDFITAPEISQMFGEMIAIFIVDAWDKIGKPEEFALIEMGPGRGTLMFDVMRILSSVPDIKGRAKIHLIETSPILRKSQKVTLDGHDIIWHNDFENLPEIPSIFIGNEFFDALPIQQFRKIQDKWQELGVKYNRFEEKFEFTLLPTTLPKSSKLLDEAEDLSVFAISPISIDIMQKIAKHIALNKGVCLVIDYGHVKTDIGDTLQAVKDHKYVPVLNDVGEVDITAHVDFEALQKSAKIVDGISASVTVNQAEFLQKLGIVYRANDLSKDPDNYATIHSQLKRLLDEGEMGKLFKVMAIYNDDIESLVGF